VKRTEPDLAAPSATPRRASAVRFHRRRLRTYPVQVVDNGDGALHLLKQELPVPAQQNDDPLTTKEGAFGRGRVAGNLLLAHLGLLACRERHGRRCALDQTHVEPMKITMPGWCRWAFKWAVLLGKPCHEQKPRNHKCDSTSRPCQVNPPRRCSSSQA
jgi:hypothetical protein